MNGTLADYELLNTLGPKELQVFDLLASSDDTEKQLAHWMGIAHATFKMHKSRLVEKLGGIGRVGIVKMAIRTGRTEA